MLIYKFLNVSKPPKFPKFSKARHDRRIDKFCKKQ
jgi:hypothetical protein